MASQLTPYVDGAKALHIGSTPRIAVEHMGDGPLVIFLHGIGGDRSTWAHQLTAFAASGYCAAAWDTRGYGDSDDYDGALSFTDIADDLARVLDAFAVNTAHIVGTSTGGCILQNLALDHPDRVRACIFNNTWVTADEFITRVALTRKRIAESYGPEEYVKVSSMFTSGANQFRHNLDAVMELERLALETVGSVEILAARLDMMLAHDRTDELKGIDRPSLVVGTVDDATIPYYFAEDLHAAIPGSQVMMFDDGGHYSYRRHPDKWNAAITDFLAEAEKTV